MSIKSTLFLFCLNISIFYTNSQLTIQNDPYSNFYSVSLPDRQVSFHRNFGPVRQIQQPQPISYSNPIQHHVANPIQQHVGNPQQFAYSNPTQHHVSYPQSELAYNAQPNSVYQPQNVPFTRNVAPIMHEMFQRAQPAQAEVVRQPQPIKYSLSSDVSSVKFSSDGLNYSF